MNDVSLVVCTPEAEEIVLKIARVSSSNPDNRDPGLISYLIRNGHWSPFEHPSMTLEINTSRAIGTQILRHRSFTFQEFSQRYAEVSLATIKYEARIKGDTNRQDSLETDNAVLQEWWKNEQMDADVESSLRYDRAIAQGIAPELARMILPLSTATKIYMTGTLRSWIHYLGDGPGGRTNPHTQKEHRDLALQGKAIFCELFPIISTALEWV